MLLKLFCLIGSTVCNAAANSLLLKGSTQRKGVRAILEIRVEAMDRFLPLYLLHAPHWIHRAKKWERTQARVQWTRRQYPQEPCRRLVDGNSGVWTATNNPPLRERRQGHHVEWTRRRHRSGRARQPLHQLAEVPGINPVHPGRRRRLVGPPPRLPLRLLHRVDRGLVWRRPPLRGWSWWRCLQGLRRAVIHG